MREKLRSERGKIIYQKRSYTVEPVFGNMKWNRQRVIMHMRGKKKVAGGLMCLAHNVGKIIHKMQIKIKAKERYGHPMMTITG